MSRQAVLVVVQFRPHCEPPRSTVWLLGCGGRQQLSAESLGRALAGGAIARGTEQSFEHNALAHCWGLACLAHCRATRLGPLARLKARGPICPPWVGSPVVRSSIVPPPCCRAGIGFALGSVTWLANSDLCTSWACLLWRRGGGAYQKASGGLQSLHRFYYVRVQVGQALGPVARPARMGFGAPVFCSVVLASVVVFVELLG